MKLVEINAVHFGSTGRIMLQIAEQMRKNGEEAYTFSEKRKATYYAGHLFFGNLAENLLHRFYSVFSGISGTGSVLGTRRLLRQLDRIQPDVIHLHNLHGWYINLPMLFAYIKKNHIKTVWTLHDCWGFTAQCSYFSIEKCEKWKTGCFACPRYRIYPYTFVDQTKKMWRLKRQWFTGVEDLTIVTPSRWLADLVKQSFLQEYPVEVIYNGVDFNVFYPHDNSFREKYDIPSEKSILLGVAFGWKDQKGLNVFIELANSLDKGKYQIVLVGTDEKVDKLLPKSIISIHKTQDQHKLAEIYTAADLFVNPTREEVLGLVNMEALACGTPLVTFKTGGSQEVPDEKSGSVVGCDDVAGLKEEIIRICTERPYLQQNCIRRARAFNHKQQCEKYIDIYKKQED